jgi:hypothetical protein
MRLAFALGVVALAACGKKPAPPPEPPRDVPVTSTTSALDLLPPLRTSSAAIANGRWEGKMTRSIAILRTREHTAHYGASMHATLAIGEDQATLCIDGSTTSSSKKREYDVHLPEGHRDHHTNDKTAIGASLRGSVVRRGLELRIALAPDPSACGDAAATTSRNALLVCVPVARDRDGGAPENLVACRWDDQAPYDGPGFEILAPDPDAGAEGELEPSAARTWILLGSTPLDASVDESWNSKRRLTL